MDEFTTIYIFNAPEEPSLCPLYLHPSFMYSRVIWATGDAATECIASFVNLMLVHKAEKKEL